MTWIIREFIDTFPPTHLPNLLWGGISTGKTSILLSDEDGLPFWKEEVFGRTRYTPKSLVSVPAKKVDGK